MTHDDREVIVNLPHVLLGIAAVVFQISAYLYAF